MWFSEITVCSNQLLTLGLILNAEMTVRFGIRSYQNSYLQKPVCLNIDTTEPLPGSLTIAKGKRSLRVSTIYEGLHENWVTVTPKKRIKSKSIFHSSKTLGFYPSPAGPILVVPSVEIGSLSDEGPPGTNTHTIINDEVTGVGNLAPNRAEGSVLANPKALASQPVSPINLNPLNAMTDDKANEDKEDDTDNVDIFPNLHNIEDVEMSSDSSKRKRSE
ncbi:hypothetical protein Cgig2_000386 [Carnegiea gigantea]|uniref:Uncharacterized protein n=1 Tax=Carnegiea gigantea TaxID=171969 RepID=A0A9Q1QD69_9CARY|nr:hypothetical protein Cgig2_000386 [Carnegiea gigantea]